MADETIVVKKEEATKKAKKKGSPIKGILFLLIFFILVPGLGITGFYFLNETFQYRLNSALSTAPLVGAYFDALPTKAEKEEQITSVAQYFLDISYDRAVDKLVLIYNEDQTMYDDILRAMMKMHPNRTKLVLEKIRDQQLKGDAVSSVLDDITEEQDVELEEMATDLLNIPFGSVREEMYKIINNGLNGHSDLARIFEKMDAVKAYDLLTLVDDVDATRILDAMTVENRSLINEEKNEDLNNKERLYNLSEIYASKSPESLVDILGSEAVYDVSDLAIIFKEMGVMNTGKILSMSEDDDFVNRVITEMKNNEVLIEGEDLITKDILKSLNIYKDFDDRILKLTNIYATIESSEVANILEQLLSNRSLPDVYVLDNGEIITISDEDRAYKILENFDDKRVAEIIGFFDDSLATEVTRKLATPNE